MIRKLCTVCKSKIIRSHSAEDVCRPCYKRIHGKARPITGRK